MTSLAPVVASAGLVLAAAGVARRGAVPARCRADGGRIGLWDRAQARGIRAPASSALSPSGDLGRLRAAIGAGASLLQALDEVGRGDGPWAHGARHAVAAATRGRPLHAAVDAWADGADDADLELLADALAIGATTGGSHALGLQVVADACARRHELQREVRALCAQARASAALLVATPVVFAVAVAALDPRVAAFTFGSPAGWLVIGTGIGLDALGAAWMAKLVRAVR